MSEEKVTSLREYLRSGWIAYGVKIAEEEGESNRIAADPRRGMATQQELLDYLEENGIEYYVARNTGESDYDEIGNDIDGCAVDLETLEWLEAFQRDANDTLCTPLTPIYIPRFDIELGRGTSEEEIAILGDLCVLVAEFRLVKGLEPDQSLDETLM